VSKNFLSEINYHQEPIDVERLDVQTTAETARKV
jgi:hypothetical protein